MESGSFVELNRRFTKNALVILALLAWLILFQDALISAVEIWYVSEIFSHGFFIIPGALYFIWQLRFEVYKQDIRPNFWVLLFLVPTLILGVVGVVGGVQVFTHISAFTVLPLAIWLCTGNAIAKIIWFPLCFMLFSIPVGEELVPFLQKITADIAIMILGWTTIPSFNNGLYIEIPQGKFVVAEACSGIRFFVGSLVFGAVYSHISYRSFKRKVAFMVLALLVPVVANAVRVFGIVVIGYFSDMKYASGADHIIYGWVFFAIVLFLLVLLGETFREKKPKLKPLESSNNELYVPMSLVVPKFPIVLVLVLLGGGMLWQSSVSLDDDPVKSMIKRQPLQSFAFEEKVKVRQWSPILSGQTDLYYGVQKREGLVEEVDFVLGWYAENREGAELVSSANALYDKEYWSILNSQTLTIGGNGASAQLLKIVSTFGGQRMVLYWYQLPDSTLHSRIKAKLYQTFDVLLGGKGAGALVAVSAYYDSNTEQAVRDQLLAVAKQNRALIFEAIPFEL